MQVKETPFGTYAKRGQLTEADKAPEATAIREMLQRIKAEVPVRAPAAPQAQPEARVGPQNAPEADLAPGTPPAAAAIPEPQEAPPTLEIVSRPGEAGYQVPEPKAPPKITRSKPKPTPEQVAAAETDLDAMMADMEEEGEAAPVAPSPAPKITPKAPKRPVPAEEQDVVDLIQQAEESIKQDEESEFDRKVRISQSEGQQQKERLSAIKESRDEQERHLQIFDEPISSGLRSKIDNWAQGGEQPHRVIGDSGNKPFKPTSQGLASANRKAQKLADKEGRVYSVVELRDDADIPQTVVIVEAPLFAARDWNPNNIPLWMWDYDLTQMNAGVQHAYPTIAQEEAPVVTPAQEVPVGEAFKGVAGFRHVTFDRKENRYKIEEVSEPGSRITYLDPSTGLVYSGDTHGDISEAVRINENRRLPSPDNVVDGFYVNGQFVDRSHERKPVDFAAIMEASATTATPAREAPAPITPQKPKRAKAEKPVVAATEKPALTKKQEDSIDRILDARDRLAAGKIDKKRFEREMQTIRTHAARLGLEVPDVGTYFHADVYRDAADQVTMDIAKRWGGHPTAKRRARRDAATAPITPSQPKPVSEESDTFTMPEETEQGKALVFIQSFLTEKGKDFTKITHDHIDKAIADISNAKAADVVAFAKSVGTSTATTRKGSLEDLSNRMHEILSDYSRPAVGGESTRDVQERANAAKQAEVKAEAPQAAEEVKEEGAAQEAPVTEEVKEPWVRPEFTRESPADISSDRTRAAQFRDEVSKFAERRREAEKKLAGTRRNAHKKRKELQTQIDNLRQKEREYEDQAYHFERIVNVAHAEDMAEKATTPEMYHAWMRARENHLAAEARARHHEGLRAKHEAEAERHDSALRDIVIDEVKKYDDELNPDEIANVIDYVIRDFTPRRDESLADSIKYGVENAKRNRSDLAQWIGSNKHVSEADKAKFTQQAAEAVKTKDWHSITNEIRKEVSAQRRRDVRRPRRRQRSQGRRLLPRVQMPRSRHGRKNARRRRNSKSRIDSGHNSRRGPRNSRPRRLLRRSSILIQLRNVRSRTSTRRMPSCSHSSRMRGRDGI